MTFGGGGEQSRESGVVCSLVDGESGCGGGGDRSYYLIECEISPNN